MKKFIVIVLCISSFSCSTSVEKVINEHKNSIVVANIVANIETDPVASGGDAADDPAIWVHSSNPSLSKVLGTDKKWGLEVYNLAGERTQRLEVGRVNNVDLRQGILGGEDIAIASNRTANTLTVFKIDTNGTVEHVGDHALAMAEPYGSCMYQNENAESFVFVNDKSGAFEQWKLVSSAPLKFDLVRRFSTPSQPEGCTANDAAGFLYFGEEAAGVWRLNLRQLDSKPERVASIADGALVADVEGMDIYHADNASYLIVSSQGDFSYAVYELGETLEYKGSFRVVRHKESGIDGAQETDGLAVTNADLGGVFSRGMLVVQDGFNRKPKEAQNFKYVSWDSIARALSL